MNTIHQLEERRSAILQQMQSIRSMLAATLKAQMLPVSHKGEVEPVLRGPYHVLAKWDPVKKKTQSRRVPRSELEQVQRDVKNHQHFLRLSAEFISLTEALGRLERETEVEEAYIKKRRTLARNRKPK